MDADTSNIGSQPKERIKREVLIQSKWVTIHQDYVLSNDGHKLDYVTVDRSDSVIIIVLKEGGLIVGEEQLRPGINKKTLDFVGGRVDSYRPIEAADITVRRELSLDESVKLNLTPITKTPLYVDSAFSSQRLHGYVVELEPNVTLPKNAKKYTYSEMLEKLECLQCRSMLLEARSRNLIP